MSSSLTGVFLREMQKKEDDDSHGDLLKKKVMRAELVVSKERKQIMTWEQKKNTQVRSQKIIEDNTSTAVVPAGQTLWLLQNPDINLEMHKIVREEIQKMENI